MKLLLSSSWPIFLLLALLLHSMDWYKRSGVTAQFFNNYSRPIYVIMDVVEISKVDGVEQSFYVDFFFNLAWQEPLVALTGLYDPSTMFQDMNDTQITAFSQVLFKTTFVNKRSMGNDDIRRLVMTGTPPPLMNLTLPYPVLPGVPWIATSQRFFGHFKAELALQNFPYDSQTLNMIIELDVPLILAFLVNNPNPVYDFAGSVKEVIGWKLQPKRDAFSVDHFKSSYQMTISRLTYVLQLDRIPDFFVNKIIIGIVLIVLMCITCVLLELPDTNRLTCVLTSFLGIVTYLFVISADLPKLPYSTKIDTFVNLSFFMVFTVWSINLFLYVMEIYAAHYQKEAAEKREKSKGNIRKQRRKYRQLRKQQCNSPTSTAAPYYPGLPKCSGKKSNPIDEDMNGTAGKEAARPDESDSASSEEDPENPKEYGVPFRWYDGWTPARRKGDLVIFVILCIFYAVATWYTLKG